MGFVGQVNAYAHSTPFSGHPNVERMAIENRNPDPADPDRGFCAFVEKREGSPDACFIAWR